MNIVLRILRVITNLILPKDEDVEKLPPHVISFPKARAINDTEPLDESECSESAYYLLAEHIVCRQCGHAACIPFGEIPEELYGGCNGGKLHDFEIVIDEERRKRLKGSWVEFIAGVNLEELEKTENPHEGIFYFNDSWWKIKSGKPVYTAHLDEIKEVRA